MLEVEGVEMEEHAGGEDEGGEDVRDKERGADVVCWWAEEVHCCGKKPAVRVD